jgi:hypothetical protein
LEDFSSADCQHSPQDNYGFCQELPAHRQGIHRKNFVCGLPTFHGINSNSAGNYQLMDVEATVRMGFPPGITSSGTRIPPEEWDSTGNNQLMEADSDQQDQNVRKILKAVTISGLASTTNRTFQLFSFYCFC